MHPEQVLRLLLGESWPDAAWDERGSGSGESGSGGLEPMPMNRPEWVFFGLLTFCDVFVLLLLVSSIGGFIGRLCDRRTTRTGHSDSTSRLRAALATQSMTVIVPCYLPNEQHILMETVEHILSRLEYPAAFTLILCYNTPTPLPVEADLARLDGKVYPGGRTLRILNVIGSHSKAENINAAMSRMVDSELVAIYDADHHPDPESLLVATAYMRAYGVDCAYWINAEFFVTHFVYFPALQFITAMGVFGGSNAVWRVATLNQYQFRCDVQTEDIELSTRVALGSVRILRFCPEARSGELPPSGFKALYRQRLRWAIGWDQVSMEHFRGIFRSKISCYRKLGLLYLLPMRWLIVLTAIFNACIAPCLSLVVLICISLCRICTGSDGGWAVTKRARDTQHFGDLDELEADPKGLRHTLPSGAAGAGSRTAASRPASLRPRGGPDGASLAAAEEGGGEYAPFEEGGGGGGGDADAAPTPPPAIATAVAGAPPDFRQRQQ
ncbi:hypothetical protein EMIHUDRAFT_96395 [Emiliania huxleyi CCMP1516]|uniref:Glycosyltransferase 2-like domain-containing protein n=2 Tax=Emiliania huxleyi TaxID=2903 RepID=A0A0D3ITW8_EMIH1|nr:hypothetical protein EMIHUDRAFT_96395 [Emiliania huxleyi CCMP1516]EOD14703.1 hypothetical protein EMIHUDRAFT_96395 [Emiliania huxleyi CCMP1516]|eukprot:XP_005767132.1 hypothetical protein EMIHUDRAFT_96395 [Emiliania huxleyi CCMP1516]